MSNLQLCEELKNLLFLIGDEEEMKKDMQEYGYDLKKKSLDALSDGQIKDGYLKLMQIGDLMNRKDFSKKYSDAFDEYLNVIPHISMEIPIEIVSSREYYNEQLELLQLMSNINIALNIRKETSMEARYKKMHCKIELVNSNSEDFKMIEKYLKTNYVPSPQRKNKPDVLHIFAVEREGEEDRFKDSANKMLLWHGSKSTNYMGILSTGLKIAPPGVVATGSDLGKGIYFADMSSKSIHYAGKSTGEVLNIQLLLLCEVSLGKVIELKEFHGKNYNPREGLCCTKAFGKKVPDEKSHIKWGDGVTVPIGEPVVGRGPWKDVNEYCVYDEAQVKMRFIVWIRGM